MLVFNDEVDDVFLVVDVFLDVSNCSGTTNNTKIERC